MKTTVRNKISAFRLPKHMVFIWFKGVREGRNGTADMDDNKIIQSGYIQMYQKRFQGFAAECIRELDYELHILSSEAEKTILDLNRSKSPLAEHMEIPAGASAIEQRAAVRSSAEINRQKFELKKKRKEALDRLIEIRTSFSALETACQEILLKTAADTEAVLASYCKGVVHKTPLLEESIPKVNANGVIQQFHEGVEWTNMCLKHIDEEVQKNHEI